MIILAKYPNEVWKKVKLSQNFAKALQNVQDISKLPVSVAFEVKDDTALSNALALLSRYGADFLVCEVREGVIIPKNVSKKAKNKNKKSNATKTKRRYKKRKTRNKMVNVVNREGGSGVGEVSEIHIEQHIGSTLEEFF